MPYKSKLKVDRANKAFVLPTIILVATTVMIILTAALQSVTTIRSNTVASYHQKLAEQAAEAGLTYAEACLKQNNRTQTWGGTKPNLTERSDCNGTITKPVNIMLPENDTMRMSFNVGDVAQKNGSSDVLLITAVGKVELRKSAGGAVLKEHEANLHRVSGKERNSSVEVASFGFHSNCSVTAGEIDCIGGSYTLDENELGEMEGAYIVDLHAGWDYHCALSNAGKVYCWGTNTSQQLGIGRPGYYDNDYIADPVEVKNQLAGKHVVSIGGSRHTTCAVTSPADGGKIYCWGSNEDGSAGIGSVSYAVPYPTQVNARYLPSNYVATKMAKSGNQSNVNVCAIINGSAYCWGDYDLLHGWGGNDNPYTTPAKVRIPGNRQVLEVASGGFTPDSPRNPRSFHCAITSDEQIYCWGDDFLDNDGANKYEMLVPYRINRGILVGKNFKHISVGKVHVCVSDTDNVVYCWGSNSSGQLGPGYVSNHDFFDPGNSIPQKVIMEPEGLAGKNIVDMYGGYHSNCAITENNGAYCWGAGFPPKPTSFAPLGSSSSAGYNYTY